jgi:hypothetical protein
VIGNWRRLLMTSLAMALSAGAPAAPKTLQARDASFDEYQVKALFLYNFANFVEWPTAAFAHTQSPIRMCLFGEVPFGTMLDAVNGTRIGERPLQITPAREISDIADGCHILFVGDDKRVHLPEFWNQIRYVYVLSVGEESGFTERGGIINIMRTADQVQFDINLGNAMERGLSVSSDLLELAREIKRNTAVPR